MDALIGKSLGPYQILAKQGGGGMATVYKGYDPGMDRSVALKVLSPILAEDPNFQGRFDQEARTVANLEHPHILQIFEYGNQDQYSYIVMPLITAGTLADRIREKSVNLLHTVKIIDQLASALDYAHSKNVIHRDLKPSNVLVNKAGNCYLTDFGIAKLREGTAHFTRTGDILGTPSYMSPEQGRGGTVDWRSDVYSLGVILYECVTGSVPFEAETPIATVMQHIDSPLPSPKLYNPHLSDAIVLVIGKALVKSPDARFQSAGELAKALQTAVTNPELILTTLGADADVEALYKAGNRDAHPPPPPVPPKPSGCSRWAWLAGLLAVLFIAIAGVTIVAGAFGGEVIGFLGTETSTPVPATDTPETPPPTETPTPTVTSEPLPPTETPTPTAPPITPTATPSTPTTTPVPEGPWGRMAFVSDRAGQDEIYVLDVSSPADKRQISDAIRGDGRDWWPDWCDENNIVFERADDPWFADYQEIVMVDVNDGEEQIITSSSMPADSTFNGVATCSHDGQTIAFSTYSSEQKIAWAIGTIERNDSSPQFRPITSDGYAVGGNVSWSPDDQAVVFNHYIESEKANHIYRVNLDDPYDYIDLSGSYGGNNKYPAWSPDGKWIAFACGKTFGDNRTWSLCLTPSGSSRIDVVLEDLHVGDEKSEDGQFKRHAVTPSWSPDSKWLAFSSDMDGDFDIYIYSLANHDLINLTDDWTSDEMDPSWGS